MDPMRPDASLKEQSAPGAQPPAERAQKLLIVDDDHDVLEGLEILFGPDAIAIRTADDGLLALELAHAWSPDVILLDLHLPSMRGVEVMNELRRANLKPRIILTSALPRRDFIELKRSMGAYEVVSKPFDIDNLRALVLHALQEPRVDCAAPSPASAGAGPEGHGEGASRDATP